VAHRGELFYEMDANGQAICQHLLLPLQPGRKDMQAPHNLEDDSLRGSETILLVDDEDMIWDVIIDMLQQLGYSVILAGNGLEAVEIYQANPGQIDLVILDMVMPKLDGHKAFFQLKAIDSKVRVLLSSGYVSEEDAADVLAAGALGFLQKPYRMADLARKVRSIFDVPRA
jgi:CheY-like chemotaxis protein